MNIPKRIDRTILRASVAKCDQITSELRSYQCIQDRQAIEWKNIHDHLDEVRRTKGSAYECEMAIEHCTDASALRSVIYELSAAGLNLHRSQTYQTLLEKAAAEELGI